MPFALRAQEVEMNCGFLFFEVAGCFVERCVKIEILEIRDLIKRFKICFQVLVTMLLLIVR